MLFGFLTVAVFVVFSTAVQAEGSLMGRMVVFNVLTYDDPKHPFLTSRDYTAKVGDGPEFGLRPEARGLAMEVVPAEIDLSATHLNVSYAESLPNTFATAAFNGYVLRFETQCVLLTDARIARDATTLALTDKDLRIEAQTLYINLSGHVFDQKSRISIALDVADCPIS